MQIWIDADACPTAVRDIVMRAALRLKVSVVFVANKTVALPESALFRFQLVAAGPDQADLYIVEQAQPGDLVVSHDIPLAAALVPKGVVVIDPRGVVFDGNNIAERLAVRDLMHDLRDTGTITGGPAPYSDKEKRRFASSFDRELTRLLRKA
ncbi:MAG: YaiI/YqxD family protein [Candidatus Obscuribacter sp.]|nr:YaiI/YqxD family protein [Candidatus Melainabacteria bacterium]MDX1990616.1 YaiI/YqxD family protein [Candidatus Obscuribacter sp.]